MDIMYKVFFLQSCMLCFVRHPFPLWMKYVAEDLYLVE